MTLDELTDSPAPAPAPAPDVAAAPSVRRAADMVRDKRTGENRPRRGPGGRPRKTAAPSPAESSAVGDGETVVVSPEEIAGAAALGNVVWNLAAPMFRHRALTDVEANQLGAALAPVVKRYLPMLGRWQYEVALAVVVFQLAQTTKLPAPELEAFPPDRYEDPSATRQMVEDAHDAAREEDRMMVR